MIRQVKPVKPDNYTQKEWDGLMQNISDGMDLTLDNDDYWNDYEDNWENDDYWDDDDDDNDEDYPDYSDK